MNVPEAAKIIGISPLNIRGWIESGTCPFGYIVRQKTRKGGRNTYVIIESRLRAFMEGKQNV